MFQHQNTSVRAHRRRASRARSIKKHSSPLDNTVFTETNPMRATAAAPVSETYVYYILGANTFTETDVERWRNYVWRLCNEHHTVPKKNVFVFKSPFLAAYGSIIQLATRVREHLTFFRHNLPIQALLQDIKDKLGQGHTVYVYGFSYGGFVTNFLAGQLSQDRAVNTSRLFMAAFGSVYLVPLTPPHICLYNYLIVGDVANKVNRRRKKPTHSCFYLTFTNPKNEVYDVCLDGGGYVIWLNPLEKMKPQENMMVKKTDWDLHYEHEVLLIHAMKHLEVGPEVFGFRTKSASKNPTEAI